MQVNCSRQTKCPKSNRNPLEPGRLFLRNISKTRRSISRAVQTTGHRRMYSSPGWCLRLRHMPSSRPTRIFKSSAARTGISPLICWHTTSNIRRLTMWTCGAHSIWSSIEGHYRCCAFRPRAGRGRAAAADAMVLGLPRNARQQLLAMVRRQQGRAFNALLEQAVRTLDIGQRTALYLKAQKIFKSEQPYTAIAYPINYYVLNKNVTGFKGYMFGATVFYGVGLKK